MTMQYRSIDADFAVSAQIRPEELIQIAQAGFKTIVCARPDHEDQGQPRFDEIASRADAMGLKAIHIPVSGGVSDGAATSMQKALRQLPRPMLGYCRSGNRAGQLYEAARQTASR